MSNNANIDDMLASASRKLRESNGADQFLRHAVMYCVRTIFFCLKDLDRRVKLLESGKTMDGGENG